MADDDFGFVERRRRGGGGERGSSNVKNEQGKLTNSNDKSSSVNLHPEYDAVDDDCRDATSGSVSIILFFPFTIYTHC